jgi:DNA-directed RNA polymerase subunit K/omega
MSEIKQDIEEKLVIEKDETNKQNKNVSPNDEIEDNSEIENDEEIENDDKLKDVSNDIPNDDTDINAIIGYENESSFESSSDSSYDSDDDLNEEYKRIERETQINTLLEYHPETSQMNYKEIITNAKIIRDKNGIIIDSLHQTIPMLTKFEKARILGLRAKQLNNGSTPFINVPNNIIKGITIAELELKAKKIPFIIRRPIPNGGSEYWKLQDLELI